ncbi:MAG: ABC transporter permease subunit [Verrucomicrobiae bacterium]|nr:ABC transporter permease subunit [Verrucomicrobiae bacterium]
MKFLPIVERELLIAARGPAAYRWRTGVAAAGLAFVALIAGLQSARGIPAPAQGMAMFRALILLSTLYAFLASVAVTADCISREKREGTLGLLFLTDLRGWDIILGKLAANSLNTIYGLLGLLPLLALPILMGGVSIAAGVGATVAVVNLLFVSLSLGICVSSLSWDERRATFAALTVGLVLLVGPLLLAGLGTYFGQPSTHAWLVAGLSPIYPLISGISLTGANAAPIALLPSHLLGWALLAMASLLAQSTWQSRGDAGARRTVDDRVFTPRHPAARAGHRRRTLDVHPLVWLLERHPGKRFYADGLVLAIVLIWAWGFRTYGTDMFGGPTWFLIVPLAFTVHLILTSWVVAESSMRLLEDRRSGALELLLCTALTDRDLIRGHRLALRRLFLRPVLLLAAAEVFVAFTGFGTSDDAAAQNGRWLMLAMASAILLDTHALSWIALRLATSLSSVNRVGLVALAITPFGPALLAALTITLVSLFTRGGSLVSFPTGLAIWFGWVVVVDLVVGWGLCRSSLLRGFRETVCHAEHRANTTA